MKSIQQLLSAHDPTFFIGTVMFLAVATVAATILVIEKFIGKGD